MSIGCGAVGNGLVSFFKTALFRFLLTYWIDHADTSVLEGHIVYFGLDKAATPLLLDLEMFFGKRLLHLAAVWRSWLADELSPTSPSVSRYLWINCNQTPDVFILLFYHVANHTRYSTVWMDTGLSSNNPRRALQLIMKSHNIRYSRCIF